MSRLMGILFLVPLLSYGCGNALLSSLLSSLLDAEDPFEALARNEMVFAAGGLLIFLNSCAVLCLGIVCYPLLEKYSKSTARFYLCIRLMEALILIVGLLFLLSVRQLAESSLLFRGQILPLLRDMHYWAYQSAMLLLGWGGMAFCYRLLRTRLLPAFLMIWGICGYGLLGLGSVLEFLGLPLGLLFSLPGGLFELFLAFWLLFCGFREAAGLSPYAD